MNQADQKRIIETMTDELKTILLQKLESGRIPEDWDGHELRELMIYHANQYRSPLMENKRGKRYKDFINTVATKGL